MPREENVAASRDLIGPRAGSTASNEPQAVSLSRGFVFCSFFGRTRQLGAFSLLFWFWGSGSFFFAVVWFDECTKTKHQF